MLAVGALGGLGRLGLVAAAVRQLFDPRLEFFSSGEQGVWYDPSDLSTLFQDSAGTTPVTAVEQPVGLMLDKRLGLVLGAELVAPLDLRTGWNVTGTVLDENSFTTTGVGGVWKDVFTAGSTYKITVAGNTTGGVEFRTWDGVTQVVRLSGFGSAIFTVPSGQTRLYIRHATAGTTNIDNISVREIPGNHAFQTTAIDRPILRNRYNLLTKTEQFDDAAWVKTNTTASIDTIQDNAVNGFHAVSQSMSFAAGSWRLRVEAKKGTAQGVFIRIRDSVDAGVTHVSVSVDLGTGLPLVAGAVGVAQVSPLADGWFGIELSGVIEPGTKVVLVGIIDGGTTFYAGQGKTSLIRKVSLVPADQASLPYQRVNTATDYDADPSKFPLYLQANGTNTWMQTNSIDFTGTDKVTVFAGVRKLSDAAIGVVAELSNSWSANTGTFAVFAPGGVSSRLDFVSKGSSQSFATTSSFPAPLNALLTCVGNISDDLVALRVNGLQVAQSALDQGTGNYGSYPLYLFRRGGTSLPANIQFHGLLIRGALTNDAQIASMERWLAPKTGVTL